MRTVLSILDGKGDTKFTWNHDDPAERASARATVATLKQQGYTFYLLDGRSPDEIDAGAGELVIRRPLAPEEVVDLDAPEGPPDVAGADPALEPTVAPAPAPKRRGRPPGVPGKTRDVVAVRPLRGG